MARRQQAFSTAQGVHLCVSHPLQSGSARAHGFCCISHVCPVEQRNRIHLVRSMFPGAGERRAEPQLLCCSLRHCRSQITNSWASLCSGVCSSCAWKTDNLAGASGAGDQHLAIKNQRALNPCHLNGGRCVLRCLAPFCVDAAARTLPSPQELTIQCGWGQVTGLSYSGGLCGLPAHTWPMRFDRQQQSRYSQALLRFFFLKKLILRCLQNRRTLQRCNREAPRCTLPPLVAFYARYSTTPRPRR